MENWGVSGVESALNESAEGVWLGHFVPYAGAISIAFELRREQWKTEPEESGRFLKALSLQSMLL